MQVIIKDLIGLPCEVDGLELTVEFDYIAPELGGWDHPDVLEGADILSITSGDEDFTYLADKHQALIETAVLNKLKELW